MIGQLGEAESKFDVEMCYEKGFIKKGPGAVVILSPGVWLYKSISRLSKYQLITTGKFTGEKLIEVVAKAPSNQFVLARECYSPCWPFGRQLSARLLFRRSTQETLLPPKDKDTTKSRTVLNDYLRRQAVIEEADSCLAELDARLMAVQYRQGVKEFGEGAIVSRGIGSRARQYDFVSLNNILSQFAGAKIVGVFEKSQICLSEIIKQCSPDSFILIEEIYYPCWPFNRQISLSIKRSEQFR